MLPRLAATFALTLFLSPLASSPVLAQTTTSEQDLVSPAHVALRLHPHNLIAAVDVKHLAGDRGRAVAREEEPGLTKLSGIATALEWSAFLIMFEH